MDIGFFEKIANRKKIVEDVKAVSEKVTKENVELIKLQVAQDSAYWELKEKLATVKGDHERLQQSMRELQMQYETLSGQYEDELRLRAETLNKLSGNREMFQAIQEYAERFRQSLLRSTADQAQLQEMYTRTDKVVCDLKQSFTQTQQKARQLEQELVSVKATNEQQNQMIQLYAASTQQTETEKARLQSELGAALRNYEDTMSTANGVIRKLELNLEKREETISILQREMEQKEKDLKSFEVENDSLKKALCNQEEFTKSVRDHNTNLEEKLAVIEDDYLKAVGVNNTLEAKIQELTALCESLTVENTKIATLQQLNEALSNEVNEIRENLASTEIAYASHRETAEDMQKRLASAIEEINKELESKASVINQMTSESQKAKEKEENLTARLTQRESTIRDKDEELSRQMSKYLELRNESQREKSSLQEKIRELEKIIENVMKEASAPRAEEALFQPEPDDNAVFAQTPEPTPRMVAPQPPPQAQPPPQPQPPSQPQLCDFMFEFFSDPSATSLDSQEVNRRFEALSRGEHLPPAPLSSLKRGHSKPQPQPQPPPRNLSTVLRPKTDKIKTRRFFKNKK